MLPEIFVQIAAYRDPEVLPTIHNAIESAHHPDRVKIGLCWQYVPGKDEPLLPPTQVPPGVRFVSVDASLGRGVCWARSVAQQLYQGEAYTLSIDSHTRFAPGWDVKLIDELNRCESQKPVLSTYPAGYEPDGQIDEAAPATVMVVREMRDGFPRFRTLLLDKAPDAPLRGLFVAGGFHFARGSIIRDAACDPYLYFDQEEIALSLKLWSRGYDVYTPTHSFVFHKYFADTTDRRLHWQDQANWNRLNELGNQRLRHLTGLARAEDSAVTADLSMYSLGLVRSLQAFTDLSGVRLGEKVSEARAYAGDFLYRLNPERTFHLLPAE